MYHLWESWSFRQTCCFVVGNSWWNRSFYFRHFQKWHLGQWKTFIQRDEWRTQRWRYSANCWCATISGTTFSILGHLSEWRTEVDGSTSVSSTTMSLVYQSEAWSRSRSANSYDESMVRWNSTHSGGTDRGDGRNKIQLQQAKAYVKSWRKKRRGAWTSEMNLHPKKLDLGGMFFFFDENVLPNLGRRRCRGLGGHGGRFWTDGFPSFLLRDLSLEKQPNKMIIRLFLVGLNGILPCHVTTRDYNFYGISKLNLRTHFSQQGSLEIKD